MGEKDLLKLTLACVLTLIVWVNPGWASNVADSCQQLYKNGQYKQAFPVCSEAAEQGNADAQFNLGSMYALGEGVKQDYAEASKWYRKAAEQGEVLAQLTLGWMYANGRGVQQDYAEAIKWYRKVAEQGHAEAQYNLGNMYVFGRGVQQNYTEAVKWYRKAAEQGNADAQYDLSKMYAFGQGVQQDYAETAKWLRKAAEQGDAKAQYNLGKMYASGKGVRQDYTEAAKWCRKASEQGHAEAQFSLGNMYANGEGVRQDVVEEVKWYHKAAEQGHVVAQYFLGLMYASGKGVRQDYAEAVKWYRKAAEQGYANAQYFLGFVYDLGEDVQQDYAEAVKWYRKAAEQGHVVAQYFLGSMYALGEGVKQDYAEASKWYRKAAEQGHARAQYNLGVMYANGDGMLQSGAAAADWYYKAGFSYLEEGKKDNALMCAERIKDMKTKMRLNVPNAFLADKLLAAIYEGGVPNASPAPGGKSEAKQDTVSFGTGWPVLGGFVVTNYHVVKGHEEFLLLCKDGQKIPATIAAYDAANDLALLKATESCKLPPALPLATKPARVGERVFTIGYPHPTLMGAEPKITDGIINSLTGVGNDPRTYQVSVPVQAGNSGGPLLNMKGKVVGIVTAKLSASEVFKWTGDLPQNVNYAIKTPYLSVLLSSTSDAADIRELRTGKKDLPTLASRIEPSVMIVIAE